MGYQLGALEPGFAQENSTWNPFEELDAQSAASLVLAVGS